MSFIQNNILESILDSIGWTLIHSLWQGLLILSLFLLMLIIFKNKSVQFKYIVSLLSLCLFLCTFVLTLLISCKHHYLIGNRFVEAAHIQTYSTKGVGSSLVVETSNWDKYLSQNLPGKLTGIIHTGLKYLKQSTGWLALTWLMIVFVLLIKHLLGYRKLASLVKDRHNQEASKWQLLLNELSLEFRLKNKVRMLISPYVNSPFVFRIFKPVILFPLKLFTRLDEDEIVAVLRHELTHLQRYDSLTNVFQIVMEALFFYQPGVWYISKQMRLQRELICDEIAGDLCADKKVYVNTLVKIEELRLELRLFAVAANRNNNELLYRIQRILNKSPKEIRKNRSFNLLPLLMTVPIFLLVSFVKFKNVKPSTEDFHNRFEEVAGKYLSYATSSMVVFDTNNERYSVFNDSISRQQYTPLSTFKIASSLFAFESGTAKDTSFTIKWDSIQNPFEPGLRNKEPYKYWYRDQNLQSAYTYSVNWFYLNLHRMIGMNQMKKYITACNYGNGDFADDIDGFWLDGSLRISSYQQVEFLRSLYKETLPGFSAKAQKATRDLMLNVSDPTYKIYGKTGTGDLGNHKLLCWYVGFVEMSENTYIFAFNTFVDQYQQMNSAKRIEIVKKVFNDLHQMQL